MNCVTRRYGIAIAVALVGLVGCTASEEGQEPAEDVVVTPDVVYGHKFGLALTFDVIRPRESNGAAVLFMNSGGFESGVLRQCRSVDSHWEFVKKDDLRIPQAPVHLPVLDQFSFEDLLSKGFTVFDVRHGSSPKFTLDEIVEDCGQAVRFIRENAQDFGIDPDRIGLWGASAGGYLAMFLGASANTPDENAEDETDQTMNEVQAVVAYYPAGFDWIESTRSFPPLLENLPALQIDPGILATLSLRNYLSAGDPPVLIIYGKDDFPFITAASESLYARFLDCGCEAKRIAFPGTGHEFSGPDGYNTQYGDQAMSELVAWFEKHLRPAAGEGERGSRNSNGRMGGWTCYLASCVSTGNFWIPDRRFTPSGMTSRKGTPWFGTLPASCRPPTWLCRLPLPFVVLIAPGSQ